MDDENAPAPGRAAEQPAEQPDREAQPVDAEPPRMTSGSITTSAGCTPIAFMFRFWATRLRSSVCTIPGFFRGGLDAPG